MSVVRSPGEAKRNPGPMDKRAPDFAALHPGYLLAWLVRALER
jgi:hypothetical protein